jgi:hypothetical protein
MILLARVNTKQNVETDSAATRESKMFYDRRLASGGDNTVNI